MQLHTFMPGINVARRVLLGIFTLPFRIGGAGKHAPKIITSILYEIMIPYGKCQVNYAQVNSHNLPQKKRKCGNKFGRCFAHNSRTEEEGTIALDQQRWMACH